MTAWRIKDFWDSLAPTEIELLIGKALLYVMMDVDERVHLKPDKSDIAPVNWEIIQNFLSGFGDVIRSLKMVRSTLETKGMDEKFLLKCRHCLDWAVILMGWDQEGMEIIEIQNEPILRFCQAACDLAEFLLPYQRWIDLVTNPNTVASQSHIAGASRVHEPPREIVNVEDVEVSPLKEWEEQTATWMAEAMKPQMVRMAKLRVELNGKFMEYIKERIMLEREVNPEYRKA